MVPRIHGAELDRAQRKSAEQREAYDFFLCARADMHNFSRKVFDGAQALFDRALEAEPRYADALGWRAYWHLLRVGQGWSSDSAFDVSEADRFARQAVECEPLNPMALAIKGHVAAYLRQDFATAYHALETSLRIDENLPLAWLWSAAAHAYTGRNAQAVREIERAIRLSPHDPLMYAYTSIASLAFLGAARTDRALAYARRSVGDNPNYTTGLKLLIASAVEAGQVPEAEAAGRRLLELEPSFSVDRFRRFSPTTASEVGDIFCRSLSRAGVPLG
jgi:tetratricopeptide (TPR) repeat protein